MHAAMSLMTTAVMQYTVCLVLDEAALRTMCSQNDSAVYWMCEFSFSRIIQTVPYDVMGRFALWAGPKDYPDSTG